MDNTDLIIRQKKYNPSNYFKIITNTLIFEDQFFVFPCYWANTPPSGWNFLVKIRYRRMEVEDQGQLL